MAGTRQILTDDDRQVRSEYTLANYDDVNNEAFRKRYMEIVKSGALPDDNRTVEEVQIDVDASELVDMLEWFELEDEIKVDLNKPAEALKQISQMMFEGSQAKLEMAAQQEELNDEEDAAEKILQVKEFTHDEDDPLLVNEFKEKKEAIVKSLIAETAKTEKYADSSKQSITSSDSGSRGLSFGSTTTTSSTTTSTVTVYKNEKGHLDSKMVKNDLDMIKKVTINNKSNVNDKDKPAYKKMFARGKFHSKNMWWNVKAWLKTKNTRRMMKLGIALSFELGMAVIAGTREFDGMGQMAAYLAMLMGASVIYSELMKDGYDPRNINFL